MFFVDFIVILLPALESANVECLLCARLLFSLSGNDRTALALKELTFKHALPSETLRFLQFLSDKVL